MTNELQDYIPATLKARIQIVASEHAYCPVYRVDKEGLQKASFLLSTYEEFSPKYPLEVFSEKYPPDDISTYSTSVYDSPKSCERFIKSLKGELRKIYPSPLIMVGQTSHGLVVHTADYNPEYKDKTHIDWWIYKGQAEDALTNFKEYVTDEKKLD
jgi:hypothetical protein